MQKGSQGDIPLHGCITREETSITWSTRSTYSVDKEKGICGMEMPVKYVVEMYIDRVSAAKNYQKDAYTDRSPLEYYENGKSMHLLHPNTRELLRTSADDARRRRRGSDV